uniref:ABC transporter domain-containing protein n=1 Tax=Macrostomum lignano TaxID=282301 RepID=A0A1I8JHF9_9PLAT
MGFFGQYGRLLLVLIKLKSWRFLFMLIVIAALFSNIYLYDIVDSWMQQRGEKNLVQVGPAEFGDRNIIVGFVPEKLRELNKLKEMIERMTGFDFSSSIEGCDSEEICNEMYFRNLLGRRSGMLSHFVHFGKYRGGASHLICQMSIGSEMHCPFMAYLVRTSQTFFNGTVHEFHSTSVFRLMSKIELFDEIVGGEMTICKKDANFPVVFPKTIMAQVICVLITLVFYLFVSTMTCIYELKQHGYLQILFRKGLGVLAYWAAIWTITLFEMALFAGVITTAYLVQCISFFSSTQLVDTFVGALLQFCLVAATVLLFSIVTKQLALSGAYCCTYLIIVVAIVLANRMYLAEGPIFVRYILLIMPAGHLAEQLFTGLTNISDNKVDSLMMHVSGGFLALTILFTVYFDFVFKSGNGWRLPCTFYFTSGFWSRPKKQPQEDDKEASAMFEAAQNWWRVLVATKGIKKSFASCMTKNEDALSNFSTKFYQDQITAVVGHNGSGKSILMQILSGERNATAGLATVDKVPITDSLTRYHMCSSIGYCPQHDGLVDRLSVSDTIKLAVLSTGKSWDREENKVRHILSSLGIESKIEESIQNLSYSEKRKVSVTIALIGQPRVVLLDDPSRDMDYISKRRLWQLLHEFKIGHSVIVSTLFINEAEAVADRIVFLSGGRVLCAGSPFFFKRAFDCRFIIQIASKTEFHVPYIIRKITSKFNSVRVRSFSNADVEFEVSVMDDSILSPVTAEIEKLAKLIDEYGIVHHSLDDVFSKLKSIPPKEVDRHFEMGTIGYVADDVDRIKALMKKKPVDPPDTPVALSVVLVQSNDLMGELFIFLFPQFAAIAPSFYGMRFAYYSLSYFWSMEQLPVPSLLNFFFSVPHLRDSIIALPVHFILLVLLLVLLENRHRCCKKGEAVTEPRVYEHCRETAIRKEIENVINVPKSQQHLMQVSVLKAINADGAVALRNLTFGLKSGEVFGLIGPCGSGKTPAMRAIAGDEKQKCAGNVDIQVNDKWLPSVTAAHQGYIGYCPRTDPLYHRLSVGENLNFYARVIGVSAGRVQQLEKELFQEQELITRVEQANAGLKRRLTLAIAQLADPPLMAIDEISSGIDHDGRQLLWNNIKSMVSKRRGIVLATQCVEEAEFLCDRMCIMNHGLMIALSSVNDLILRYKTMYFLEMQIASNTKETHEALQRRKDQLAAIVLDKFYGAILIEQWTARMQFALPIQSIGCLSNTLDWLYSSKCKLNIHYFTLHYATPPSTRS